MTRRERIVFLLEHLNDCLGPAGSASAGSGDGDGPGFVLTSSMAVHPSVVELRRCLRLLGRLAPNHREAVETWFCCNWYVKRVPKTVRRNGRVVRVLNRDGSQAFDMRRVRGLPPWLKACPVDRGTGEPRPVALGVDFICGVFRGEPFVPEQLREAA
jgi:hypothetical protein